MLEVIINAAEQNMTGKKVPDVTFRVCENDEWKYKRAKHCWKG